MTVCECVLSCPRLAQGLCSFGMNATELTVPRLGLRLRVEPELESRHGESAELAESMRPQYKFGPLGESSFRPTGCKIKGLAAPPLASLPSCKQHNCVLHICWPRKSPVGPLQQPQQCTVQCLTTMHSRKCNGMYCQPHTQPCCGVLVCHPPHAHPILYCCCT